LDDCFLHKNSKNETCPHHSPSLNSITSYPFYLLFLPHLPISPSSHTCFHVSLSFLVHCSPRDLELAVPPAWNRSFNLLDL
jgi:hypothetical protein